MYRVSNAIKKIKRTCVEPCTHIAYSLLYIAYAIVCQCIASFLMNPFKCSRKIYMYRKKSRFRKYHVLLFTLPNLVKYLRNLHALKTKHDFSVNKSQRCKTRLRLRAATRFENTFSSKIVDVPVANCEIAHVRRRRF